jgi:hypothetical protein
VVMKRRSIGLGIVCGDYSVGDRRRKVTRYSSREGHV